jgi:predicted MFS family arabinose efflux permease
MNEPHVTKGRGYILGLLFLLNLFNYVDRYLPAILLPSIRKDLDLNDSQLAFITGAAFALFYSVMCLPLGRMSDHMNRRKVLAVCVGLWSVATTITGFAQNFLHMAIARFGVGVGEAGLNPCAQSMISDLYAQKGRRATAVAVFASGIPVGTVVAFLAGGNLDAMVGWRNAFIIVGAPGIVLALIVWFFLKEPVRGAADGFVDTGKAPSLWETIKTLWGIRVWRYMMFGTGFSGTCNVCCTVWAPSYLSRSFGMSAADIGNFTAPALGIGGFIGTMMGGILVDKLRSKNQRWGAWLPMITLAMCVFPTFMVFSAKTSTEAILWLTLPLVLIPTHLACFTTASQSVAPLRMRGTAPALSLLITAGIMGLGLGPQVIGGLSDLMRDTEGEESLRYALLIVAPTAAALASFFFYWGSRTITQDIADAAAKQSGLTAAAAGVR